MICSIDETVNQTAAFIFIDTSTKFAFVPLKRQRNSGIKKCLLHHSDSIYSVASLPLSGKDGYGSIINFQTLKKIIMESMLSLEVLNNVSEIDIVYKRKTKCLMSDRPLISTSADAYKVFLHYWNGDKIDLLEEFKVIFLNRSNRVMQIFTVSQGGITGTVADARLILGAAVKIAACAMILAHNHPSGSMKPSRADEELTRKIKEAAGYFDIKVLDHVIISPENYYSFADEGLL